MSNITPIRAPQPQWGGGGWDGHHHHHDGWEWNGSQWVWCDPPQPWPQPPCPPPPPQQCGPPSCMSAVAKAQACYDQSQSLYNLVSQVVSDIFAKNPGIIPSPPPSAGSGPILGVTDGSDAAPGEVGEYIQFRINAPVTSNQTTTTALSMGVLQPGDWACTIMLEDFAWSSGNLFSLQPIPAGFSTAMFGSSVVWDSAAPTGQPGEQASTIGGVPARALIAVPTLVAFSVTTNWLALVTQPGQVATLTFQAWRMR